MSNPYRLEDDKYELFMEACRLKMDELGLEHSPENFIAILQDWFYILTDQSAVQTYVDAMHDAHKAAEIAALEAALAELQGT